MSITIDTTIGGATANSYNAVAQVDAYAIGAQPSDAAAWAALATDDAKAVFLIRATRVLDTVPFSGLLVSTTQALQWPRVGVDIPVGFGLFFGFYGAYYPPTVIPPAVMEAHARLTLFLAVNATNDPFSTGDAGPLSALKVGSLDLTFRAGAATTGRDFLEREIYPILAKGNCTGSARSVRLTR